MGLYIDKNGNIFIAHFFDHNIAVLMAKIRCSRCAPGSGAILCIAFRRRLAFDIFLDSTEICTLRIIMPMTTQNDDPYNNAVLTGTWPGAS